MDNNQLLQELNSFTRREHTEDEVYIFSVTLCDNDIDRDKEQFSLASLQQLQKLFIGKTGIFDHNAKGINQTARIFLTEIVSNPEKKNAVGEEYSALNANAYMIRTSSNEDLIKEIDGGIKKEVSVSCLADKNICSICGADIKVKACSHVKGKIYNGKMCYHILEEISDAYEWSFVAVPAQKNAGVIKHFSGCDYSKVGNFTVSDDDSYKTVDNDTVNKIYDETKAEIIRLSFLSGENISKAVMENLMDRMTILELYELKKSYQGRNSKDYKPQLTGGSIANTAFKF